MTLVNPATIDLPATIDRNPTTIDRPATIDFPSLGGSRRSGGRRRSCLWRSDLFHPHRQKLEHRVLQPVGTLELTDDAPFRPEMQIHEGALPLPLDLVGQLFLPPVLRLQQRRSGLRDYAFHFLNELVGVFVGDRRAHNEDRLVELHAADLLMDHSDHWPQAEAWSEGSAASPYVMQARGRYHSARRAVN